MSPAEPAHSFQGNKMPKKKQAKPILRNPVILANGAVQAQVYNDKRFRDGDWIMTSQVQKIITKNTEYEMENT